MKYDPVCHCGIPLSIHSVYDNHSFTEMETQESMQAKIDELAFALDSLRESTLKLVGVVTEQKCGGVWLAVKEICGEVSHAAQLEPATIIAAHDQRLFELILGRLERDNITDDGTRYGVAVAAKWIRELAGTIS